MFYLIQHIESYKHVFAVRQLVDVEILGHFAIHHALVSYALALQQRLVFRIYLAQYVPCSDETLLQLGRLFNIEVGEELRQRFFLLLFKKLITVCQVVQVFQVREKRFGICHVFVGIVEVGDKHFAPEVEIV